jgi:glutamine amidotransferase
VIAIINYGVGNIKSIQKAVEFVGGKATVTSDVDVIRNADGIVLPGVGAFKAAMENLKDFVEIIKETTVPILGICLGMQLFATESEEGGLHRGLNMIPGRVVRFPNSVGKVPHMGWNRIKITRDHEILDGVEDGSYVYFVHSYHMKTDDKYIITKTEYGIEFTSGVAKDNVVGFQFHPEKSGKVGLKMVKNFVEMCKR